MKKTFLICVAIVAVFAGAVLRFDPSYADILYDEDNLIEDLTIAVCGIALGLSLAISFLRHKKGLKHRFWLFFSLFLLIFIGEEISWGIGYLGFAKQKVAGINFDGLHDIFSIGISAVKLTRDHIVSIGILNIKSLAILTGTAAVILPGVYFLIRGLIKNRERIYNFFSKNLRWEPFLFLILGLILILAAMVIDDDNLVNFPHKAVVEESIELIAAVSFLFTSLSGLRERKNV